MFSFSIIGAYVANRGRVNLARQLARNWGIPVEQVQHSDINTAVVEEGLRHALSSSLAPFVWVTLCCRYSSGRPSCSAASIYLAATLRYVALLLKGRKRCHAPFKQMMRRVLSVERPACAKSVRTQHFVI